MKELTQDLSRRLLYILHRGMVEARNLSYAGHSEQVADLADAMEYLPILMLKWNQHSDSWEMVRHVLKTYEDKYPTGRYEYTPYLEQNPLPEY
jgi:hypothetical protein